MVLRLQLRQQPLNRLSGSMVDTLELLGMEEPVGGTATFKLYPPGNSTCAGEPAWLREVPVVGPPNAEKIVRVTSPVYTPTAPGTYRWVASYSGFGPNPARTGLCNEPNETVEVSLGDLRRGVNSKSYYSDDTTPVSVPWLNDVAGLGAGRVRLDIRWNAPASPAECGTSDADVKTALGVFKTAITGYLGRRVQPLVVLGGGILSISPIPIPVPPDPPNLFGPMGTKTCAATGMTYINAFKARAKLIATELYALGVRDFQIWNEPNVPERPDGEGVTRPNPEYMTPEVYADLFFAAADAIKTEMPDANMVTAGIYFNDESNDSSKLYLVDVMKALKGKPTIRWNQVGLHAYFENATDPEEDPGTGAATRITEVATGLANENVSPRTLWITEFGKPRICLDESCTDPSTLQTQASELTAWYTMMASKFGTEVDASFWFAHDNRETEHIPPEPPEPEKWQSYGLTAISSAGTIARSDHRPAWETLELIIANAQ